MTGRVFLDSNVLVYSLDERDPEKHRRSRAWVRYLWDRKVGRLSYQVLQEFYMVVTRKLKPPVTPEVARRAVESLFAWRPVAPDVELVRHAWVLQDRYEISFWDGLIVAAAKAAECGILLTEDLQHGQDLDGLLVVSPFLLEPEALATPGWIAESRPAPSIE